MGEGRERQACSKAEKAEWEWSYREATAGRDRGGDMVRDGGRRR